MFPGMSERLCKELSALAPPSMTVEVIAPPERQQLAWLGGSTLASLANFQQTFSTKQALRTLALALALTLARTLARILARTVAPAPTRTRTRTLALGPTPTRTLNPSPDPHPNPHPHPHPHPQPNPDAKQDYSRAGSSVVHRVIGLVDDGLKPGFMDKLGAMDDLDDMAPINAALDTSDRGERLHYH